ncbi:MAG: YdcF family protein [Pseudomonadota bacterium]
MSPLKKISFGLLAALTLWVIGFVGFAVSSVTAKPKGQDETTDAIVVLTGGKNRVQEGLELFAKGRASHLFISGVFKDVTKREILRQWNGEHALPPCCVTLGYNASSTTQNAAETREWIVENDYSSVRLVTGNYHMPRSLMEFKHALPGVDIYANPLKQPDLSIFSARMWVLLFSEYHKSLFRRVQLIFTPRPKMPDDEE